MLDTAISVLVVDDSATIRKVLARILNQIGFTRVESAANAETALQMLREREFGLALIDWYMDETLGIDIVRSMRRDYRLKDVPVILISAHASAENVINAKEAGARGYLVKPFSVEALKAKLDDMWAVA